MDTFSKGYWMGFGMGAAGALIPNCYDRKYAEAAGIEESEILSFSFGDGLFEGYHDALRQGGSTTESVSDTEIKDILGL